MAFLRDGAACALLLSLVGCASAPPSDRPGENGGPSALATPRARLFISPAGEPFRPDGGPLPPLHAWFAGADLDRDGALSRAEMAQDHARFFAALDVDGDGVIAGREVTRYEQEIAPEILTGSRPGDGGSRAGAPRAGAPGGGGGRGGRGGGGRGGGGRGGGAGADGPRGASGGGDGGGPGAGRVRVGAARFSLINEPQPIRAADADLNFKVTAAEWSAAAERRSRLLDRNGDGRLEIAELRAPASGPGVGGKIKAPR